MYHYYFYHHCCSNRKIDIQGKKAQYLGIVGYLSTMSKLGYCDCDYHIFAVRNR